MSKLMNPNAICGNGKVEEGETCDAGRENGTIKCSSDCLYVGEVRSGSNTGSIDEYNSGDENYSRSNNWGNGLKSAESMFQNGKDILNNIFDAGSDALNSAKNSARDFIVENTSPRTRAIMKKTAEVAVVAAEYSVIGVATLLGVAAASLNIMVFRSQWKTYTVQEGDSIDAISSKFNMTERAIRRKNGKLKK